MSSFIENVLIIVANGKCYSFLNNVLKRGILQGLGDVLPLCHMYSIRLIFPNFPLLRKKEEEMKEPRAITTKKKKKNFMKNENYSGIKDKKNEMYLNEFRKLIQF